ncbi:hypothetical protein JCM10213_001147 [Rhodosporidiobolus nylandii]
MGLSYVDDTDSSWSYSGAWIHYSGKTKDIDASSWYQKTFSSIDMPRHPDADGGTATFTFTGSAAVLYGDYNTCQGRYWCAVDDNERHWYNAGSAAGIAAGSLNVTRCAVSGVSNSEHTITLGQTGPDGKTCGVTVDFAVVDDSGRTSTVSWYSAFDSINPPSGLEDSTMVPKTASSTVDSSTVASSSFSLSASTSSTSSSQSTFSSSSLPSFSTASSTFATSLRISTTLSSADVVSTVSLASGLTSTIPNQAAVPDSSASASPQNSSDSGGVNAVGIGVGCGVGGIALIGGLAFLAYRAKKKRSSDYATSYAASQSPTDGQTMRSASVAQTHARMNSTYSAQTGATPFHDAAFSGPVAFETYQRPVSVYPEVQDDSALPYRQTSSYHSPVEGPHYLEELVSPAAPVRSPSIPPSLDDPHTFRPRYY